MKKNEFFFRKSELERAEAGDKQIVTKQNDEKADVDREAKCSTRQEQNDRKTCL